jgi:transcription elongation factor GreA
MATNKKQMLYTPDGYRELVDELNYLKTVRREEIKADIATARSFGDLSENAEYDEARNEQARTEARIKELEELIENAVVVDEAEIDTSVVSLGSVVRVRDEADGEGTEYSLVGSNEANPLIGKISDQSPIGKKLMGTREGALIQVDAPIGTITLKVLSVTRSK